MFAPRLRCLNDGQLESDGDHMTLLARMAALFTRAVLATGTSALSVAIFQDETQVSVVDIAPPRIVSEIEVQ